MASVARSLSCVCVCVCVCVWLGRQPIVCGGEDLLRLFVYLFDGEGAAAREGNTVKKEFYSWNWLTALGAGTCINTASWQKSDKFSGALVNYQFGA